MLPEFCPNPRCTYHNATQVNYSGHWVSRGTYDTLVVGPVHRFTCSACGRGFSERTFSIQYYTKLKLDLKEIYRATSAAESISSIARHLHCSGDSIQNRVDRLARAGLFAHAQLRGYQSLREDLVADGFESFDRSQYYPNNINLLVGKDSQFLYTQTHATLRRKGRMSARQKLMREKLESSYKPPKGALIHAFTRLLEYIFCIWKPEQYPKLALWTDEHYAYPLAIAKLVNLVESRKTGSFEHIRHPAKAARTLHNPLFAVNYYDRELRKDIAAFRRESTCFTRNPSNGMARFILHMVWHNYQKPHRVRVSRLKKVHAEAAGIPETAIQDELTKVFEWRPFLSKCQLTLDENMIWLKKTITPGSKKLNYMPKYALVC